MAGQSLRVVPGADERRDGGQTDDSAALPDRRQQVVRQVPGAGVLGERVRMGCQHRPGEPLQRRSAGRGGEVRDVERDAQLFHPPKQLPALTGDAAAAIVADAVGECVGVVPGQPDHPQAAPIQLRQPLRMALQPGGVLERQHAGHGARAHRGAQLGHRRHHAQRAAGLLLLASGGIELGDDPLPGVAAQLIVGIHGQHLHGHPAVAQRLLVAAAEHVAAAPGALEGRIEQQVEVQIDDQTRMQAARCSGVVPSLGVRSSGSMCGHSGVTSGHRG